ncbi:MAG: hypothetical protein KC656_23515, partial [Myxococcales bacterium]|nr:hypothetical protein [Myxococcales bacterium]
LTAYYNKASTSQHLRGMQVGMSGGGNGVHVAQVVFFTDGKHPLVMKDASVGSTRTLIGDTVDGDYFWLQPGS